MDPSLSGISQGNVRRLLDFHNAEIQKSNVNLIQSRIGVVANHTLPVASTSNLTMNHHVAPQPLNPQNELTQVIVTSNPGPLEAKNKERRKTTRDMRHRLQESHDVEGLSKLMIEAKDKSGRCENKEGSKRYYENEIKKISLCLEFSKRRMDSAGNINKLNNLKDDLQKLLKKDNGPITTKYLNKELELIYDEIDKADTLIAREQVPIAESSNPQEDFPWEASSSTSVETSDSEHLAILNNGLLSKEQKISDLKKLLGRFEAEDDPDGKGKGGINTKLNKQMEIIKNEISKLEHQNNLLAETIKNYEDAQQLEGFRRLKGYVNFDPKMDIELKNICDNFKPKSNESIERASNLINQLLKELMKGNIDTLFFMMRNTNTGKISRDTFDYLNVLCDLLSEKNTLKNLRPFFGKPLLKKDNINLLRTTLVKVGKINAGVQNCIRQANQICLLEITHYGERHPNNAGNITQTIQLFEQNINLSRGMFNQNKDAIKETLKELGRDFKTNLGEGISFINDLAETPAVGVSIADQSKSEISKSQYESTRVFTEALSAVFSQKMETPMVIYSAFSPLSQCFKGNRFDKSDFVDNFSKVFLIFERYKSVDLKNSEFWNGNKKHAENLISSLNEFLDSEGKLNEGKTIADFQERMIEISNNFGNLDKNLNESYFQINSPRMVTNQDTLSIYEVVTRSLTGLCESFGTNIAKYDRS